MPFLGTPPHLPSDYPRPTIPPSISQLFRTNSVPSSRDTERIRLLLDERKAELAIFTQEIERARAHVLHLERERDQVRDIVHELQALVSPVRRLPMDVMAKVFEHCIWDQAITPTADPRVSPLLLGQVCRAWRYLLFSLPCLWTALQINLPATTNDWEALVQSKCLSMYVWLSRSRALPISLSLNHAKGSHIPWHALVHLDKEIHSLSHRFKNLSLHLSSRSLGSLLTFTQNPLPHLEHLELHNSNALPTNQNTPPITLHSAPNLKSLSLSWSSLDLERFQIPWNQLQHLSLEYDASSFWNPVHSDYLHTLACCPNLATLSLGIGALIHDIDPPIAPVTLARVHTFKLSLFVQTRYLDHFFDALRMPQLRHVDINNVSLALGSFTGQIECLPFLARCADTLESVEFTRIDIADAAVVGCLRQLHRLRQLSFLPGILRLNHGLVGALAHGGMSTSGCDSDGQGDVSVDEPEWICPALEELHLRCSSVVPVDAIVRLVSSRCQTPPRLKRFVLQLATFEYGLDTRDDKIKEVQMRLRTYVEAGLQLVLTKSNSSGC